MLFSPEEIETARCSRAERERAVRLADMLGELTEIVSKEGLFTLGRYDSVQEGFLSEGIKIVLETEDGSLKALREAALSGGNRGRALLERLMIAQGLAGIASGEGAPLVRLKVKAYAGPELFFEERREEAIRGLMSLGFDRATAQTLV